MTTKTMQIYLYIGVNQLYGKVLNIFSLPTNLYGYKEVYLIVYIPFKELESDYNAR